MGLVVEVLSQDASVDVDDGAATGDVCIAPASFPAVAAPAEDMETAEYSPGTSQSQDQDQAGQGSADWAVVRQAGQLEAGGYVGDHSADSGPVMLHFPVGEWRGCQIRRSDVPGQRLFANFKPRF